MNTLNIDILEDKLLDVQIEKKAADRINKKHQVYSEKDVFGKNGLDDIQESEGDGWE